MSLHECYGSNHNAEPAAPGVKQTVGRTAGQAVVTALVARTAAAKGGLVEQYGQLKWSEGLLTARRTREAHLEEVHVALSRVPRRARVPQAAAKARDRTVLYATQICTLEKRVGEVKKDHHHHVAKSLRRVQ